MDPERQEPAASEDAADSPFPAAAAEPAPPPAEDEPDAAPEPETEDEEEESPEPPRNARETALAERLAAVENERRQEQVQADQHRERQNIAAISGGVDKFLDTMNDNAAQIYDDADRKRYIKTETTRITQWQASELGNIAEARESRAWSAYEYVAVPMYIQEEVKTAKLPAYMAKEIAEQVQSGALHPSQVRATTTLLAKERARNAPTRKAAEQARRTTEARRVMHDTAGPGSGGGASRDIVPGSDEHLLNIFATRRR